MNAADVMINLERRFKQERPPIPGHTLITYDEYLALKEMIDDLREFKIFLENEGQ